MEYRSKPPKTKVSLSSEGKANVNKDVSWSYDLVFACFPLSFFLFPFLLSCLSCDGFCRIPFRLCFFLLISFYFFLFFLMMHVHFFKLLLLPCHCFPPPASCILFFIILFASFCIFIRRFAFPSGFAFWNEAKMKGKTKAKFTTSRLAWT